MAESWAVDGIELPEGFDFPITKLGQTADVHGEGVFASDTPTRVECYVRVRPEPRGYSSRRRARGDYLFHHFQLSS